VKKRVPTSKTFSKSILVLVAVSFLFGLFVSAQPAMAEEYDPKEAGHPLKIFAYIIFPVGTFLDYAIMRPAFWVVQKEPLRTIFGFDAMTRSDKEVNPGPMGVLLEEQQ